MDPSGLETTGQMIVWGDDYAENLAEARSYRCTFCKRGFSNAQALGGHMNIHRRDRAKLREFSSENMLSLDSTKSRDCEGSSPPSDSSARERVGLESDDHTKKAQDLSDVDRKDHNLIGCLPLFADAPSVEEPAAGSRVGSKHVKLGREELRPGELDLELRLGPEPDRPGAKSKPLL